MPPYVITPYPDGDYWAYNFAALTPSIPAADRQSYYGSFTRDVCDKYLSVFADFKFTRSFFDSALAATPFAPDAFKQPNGIELSPIGISVPIQNPFNPFTVGDTTLVINGVPVPMTTGVHFRGINDQVVRTNKITFQDALFDVGLRGELGEFGDYFKNWNWGLGFRYSRNFEQILTGGVVSRSGLRAALLDTNHFESSRVNRDVWATYQEVRIPITSPAWNFPGMYSLEFDVAEREEWYSQNTSATSVLEAQHSQYNAQKPKFSVRWQPLDPKWIGTLTLRASYTEAFHAATLPDLTPAGTEFFATFPDNLRDPRGLTPPGTGVPVIVTGNPNLQPEVAYEWSYGAVYSPKWIKGLTLSTDFWHIDLRSIVSFVAPRNSLLILRTAFRAWSLVIR